MTPLDYSVVIATYERAEDLRRTLESLAAQTRLPASVVIVDASHDEQSRNVVDKHADVLPIRYQRAIEPSSAQQRNAGAEHVTTPLIAFMDDDVVLPSDTCATLAAVFEADAREEIGGVSGRIDGASRPVPRGALWWYYRVQAGYADATYGGKLFGPAITCYPSYTETADALVPAQWLASTLVFYRTPLFRREQFPRFAGYSFMEDVHLSAHIARTHRLYYHAGAPFEHREATSPWKRDSRALARGRIRNQRLVAREVLGFTGPIFETKLLLHRLFVTIHLLRRRGPGWLGEIAGTWQ